MKLLAVVSAVWLLGCSAATARAKEWPGLVPSKSTRAAPAPQESVIGLTP